MKPSILTSALLSLLFPIPAIAQHLPNAGSIPGVPSHPGVPVTPAVEAETGDLLKHNYLILVKVKNGDTMSEFAALTASATIDLRAMWGGEAKPAITFGGTLKEMEGGKLVLDYEIEARVPVVPDKRNVEAAPKEIKIAGMEDETVRILSSALARSQGKYNQLINSGYGRRHPLVVGLTAQIAEEREILETSAEKFLTSQGIIEQMGATSVKKQENTEESSTGSLHVEPGNTYEILKAGVRSYSLTITPADDAGEGAQGESQK